MNAYEAYKKYLAIKLHFQQDSYDYFKFSGSVKANKESFESRRDKYFFQRLAKLYTDEQYLQLLVSNFIHNSDIWVGDILSESARTNYVNWKKTYQSLNYVFTEDMLKIENYLQEKNISDFNLLFNSKKTWPDIVTIGIQKTITIESFIIMNKILNFIPKISKNIEDTIVWPEFKKLCLKYSPFLDVDLKKYKKTMRDIFVTKPLDSGV
ncbi:59 protein [uncultured Caudovirales phage]|uniref:59 protein n=1 Tax=uncultured Caudovirales phage TaxID=2100421 RepID=A0A6J5M526_9CAUD|nr:59 protein [uncultured Caudovirales phage]